MDAIFKFGKMTRCVCSLEWITNAENFVWFFSPSVPIGARTRAIQTRYDPNISAYVIASDEYGYALEQACV